MKPRTLKLYNTLSGKKEPLKTQIEGEVTLYGCGPTVYGYTHVGNARAALTFDLVVRALQYFGYKVSFARNYTDVDDKIIAVAEKEGRSATEVSEYFIEAYRTDLKNLKTREPEFCPKVTETIPEIISFVQDLISKGSAYTLKTENGTDVYFRVSSFRDYGKLSHRKLDDLVSGSRADVEKAKEHEADFALWKAAKQNEPSWDSPWGPGRPGWHIECSAMIYKLFKGTIDIHMGGLDLIFPHHENEIAQSEALTRKPLASFWLHNGLLEFGHEKMSKSLGNIVTTKEFLNRYHPEVLRLLFLQQHYRGPLDFSDETVGRAEALLERLYLCANRGQSAEGEVGGDIPAELSNLSVNIEEALLDDLGTAKALGLILSAARLCFRENKHHYWKAWMGCVKVMQDVFGVLTDDFEHFSAKNKKLRLARFKISEAEAQMIESRVAERETARAEKRFADSDRIRTELEAIGVVVMDGPDGTSWTMKGTKDS